MGLYAWRVFQEITLIDASCWFWNCISEQGVCWVRFGACFASSSFKGPGLEIFIGEFFGRLFGLSQDHFDTVNPGGPDPVGRVRQLVCSGFSGRKSGDRIASLRVL